MTKEEYGDLLADIGGGNEIGIAARRERSAAERAVLAEHDTRFWALLCLGDAVHQFYRDTLAIVGPELARRTDPVEIASCNWHLVSFGRFAAAFHLMAHGYYFEAVMLARDLWEVALSLAALRTGVVTLEELMSTAAEDPRGMEAISRRADKKIKEALIWENSKLGSAGRQAVETVLTIANLATHKSKLHLAVNMHRGSQDGELSIYPYFDLRRAAVANNMLDLAAWCLISTLPYLPFDASSTWQRQYGKVQRAFREGPGRGPDATVRAWPEIIEHVFLYKPEA
jgi:hypothetical protein